MTANAADPPLADADHVRGLLVGRGIVPSGHRIEIGRLLFAAHRHLTAEQVLATLRAAGHGVSRATVYNTLNLYAARGLLQTLCLDPARTWFDSNVAPHFHVLDLDTGEWSDVPPEMLGFSRLPALPDGSEAAAIDVVIRVRRRKS